LYTYTFTIVDFIKDDYRYLTQVSKSILYDRKWKLTWIILQCACLNTLRNIWAEESEKLKASETVIPTSHNEDIGLVKLLLPSCTVPEVHTHSPGVSFHSQSSVLFHDLALLFYEWYLWD
jgi:hypothetical protein